MDLKYITDFVGHHAKSKPRKAALVIEDVSYSWESINQSMIDIAVYLSKYLDSNNQQVVALMLPNSWDYVVWYLAVLELGHIVMPIDAGYKQLEIDNICQQIKPSLIIANRLTAQNFKRQSTSLVSTESLPEVSSLPSYKKLRKGAEVQIATLLFTSGTTGQPKAAPYTHANHMWNITTSSKLWDWTSKDTLLITLPLSHWYGLVMGLSGAIYHGNTLYLHEYPDTKKTLQVLASGKVSIFTHVAGVYSKMALRKFEENYDLSAVRLCISGGAPLPPYVWEKFKQKYDIEIIEAYGSSETGRIASNTLKQRTPGSPGEPLPGVKVKLASNNELLIKSPGLFPGYYKNQSQTKQKYTIDGWWKSGDIADINNGKIFLKSRLQERINKNGYTLYPRDIEWALLQLRSVEEAFVLGLQKIEQVSDQIIYFIVGHVTEQEVMGHSQQNMPSSWLPDKVFLLSELPRTKTGKPELAKLRAMAA